MTCEVSSMGGVGSTSFEGREQRGRPSRPTPPLLTTLAPTDTFPRKDGKPAVSKGGDEGRALALVSVLTDTITPISVAKVHQFRVYSTMVIMDWGEAKRNIMVELFEMWAMVEALGLICLPLTITVCHNLPDRGWAFSKTIGVALLAFCVWLPLMSIHLLPFSQFFILGIVLIILACNLLGFWRTYHTIIKMVRRNISYIIVTEVVFVGMVLLLGWLRSYRPDIRNFEMFMDEGFLAAIMRSPHLPPNDMWLAGYSINYYYYAHFTIAVLAKLLGQIPSIAFNTGISVIFGLTAVNLFDVTCNIVSWAHHVRAHARTQPALPLARPDQVYPPLPGSMPYGLFTIVMGLVLGNLAATQQWWENHGDGLLQAHFDWFGPSRVIEKTINEFPAFSFLLSCFHAHTLTLAFTILAVGLAFNLYLERGSKGLFEGQANSQDG